MANVWCADDTFAAQFIFLDDRNLIVDLPKRKNQEQMRNALMSGSSPAAVVTSLSTDIPLTSITRIATDKHDEDIEIRYKVGNETKNETLRMANPDKRDEVWAQLNAIFGDKFNQFEDAKSIPEATFGALAALTFFGCISWLLAAAASAFRAADGDYDIEGRHQGAKALFAWLMEFLGPIGVWIIGGIFCALSFMAVVNAVLQPPVMKILQEEPYKPQGLLMLVLKYSVLGVVWYFVLKAFLI